MRFQINILSIFCIFYSSRTASKIAAGSLLIQAYMMTTVTIVSHGEDEAYWNKRKKYSKKRLKIWSIFNVVNGIFAIVLQVCLNYTVKFPIEWSYLQRLLQKKTIYFSMQNVDLYISILYKSRPLYIKLFSWIVNIDKFNCSL